jgi:diacylglycerol kinase family enzyme
VTQVRPELWRRALAALALLSTAAALAIALWGLWGNVARLAVSIVLVLVLVLAGWYALTRTGGRRLAGITVAGVAAVGLVVALLGGQRHGVVLALVIVLAAISVLSAPVALGVEARSPAGSAPAGRSVPPARLGVVIINLASGGGKAERCHLADEARRRGIEPVVLRPGDDLRQLAVAAVERGADVIGMAGGDGSQALVASVAADHDVGYVCIPAGTRNHFALDLGLDRDDVVGALDAFGDAVERRVDLASVNGRVFVNNVSLGVYAKIVRSPEYRDAKRQTTGLMLPELLGPDAPTFDLHFDGPDGPVDGAQLIQVSNNPYRLTRAPGFGTRARMDTGRLGVAALHLTSDTDVARIVALGRLDRFDGWLEWSTPSFEVRSGQPVDAGVDGEALVLDPPLAFVTRPAAVRVRIPPHAPGRSPAARSEGRFVDTLRSLVAVVAGRPR